MIVAARCVAGERCHIAALARRMRAIDRIECAAMGFGPEAALWRGLDRSAWTQTALIDGVPHAMFGVMVESAQASIAVPWFLGSDHVMHHARQLVREGPAIIAAMHEQGRTLRNFVSAANGRAIRLLEHWGFVVEDPVVTVRGVAFRRFIREID